MNFRFIMLCAFLLGGSTTLTLGQETTHTHTPTREELDTVAQGVDKLDLQTRPRINQHVDQPQWAGDGLGKFIADDAWLSKQSKDLLNIIKILYKGREADLKVLEDAQSAMSLEDQIERRIALIKATLGGTHKIPENIANIPGFKTGNVDGTAVGVKTVIISNEEWLGKESQYLLDIIMILYKGREADVLQLEEAQAKMESQDQIERRIALIKATLAKNTTKP